MAQAHVPAYCPPVCCACCVGLIYKAVLLTNCHFVGRLLAAVLERVTVTEWHSQQPPASLLACNAMPAARATSVLCTVT
jgi:hypothetical protein